MQLVLTKISTNFCLRAWEGDRRGGGGGEEPYPSPSDTSRWLTGREDSVRPLRRDKTDEEYVGFLRTAA